MHYIMNNNMINKPNNELSVIEELSSHFPVIGIYLNEFALYNFDENVSFDSYYQITDTFVILIVNKGTLNIKSGDSNYSLSGGTIACVPPGEALSLNLNKSQTNGYIMAFSSAFSKLLQIPIGLTKDKLLFKDSDSDSTETTLRRIIMLIKDELSDNDNEDLFRKEKLLNLVSVFYIEILNAYAKMSPIARKLYKPDGISRKNKICKDFLILLNQHSREERQLKFYANKLCISPKHLSLLIKETTGLSANRWITDAVIHEAKRLLLDSENSVKEISYLLNFPSQSFFGKYFKREVGLSPSNYQNEVLC